MSERKAGLAEVSIAVVCLDKHTGHDWDGRLYVRTESEPYRFRGMLELAGKMEKFYNKIDYPQASVRDRSFYAEFGNRVKREREQAEAMRMGRKGEQDVVMDEEEIMEKHGDEATFVVRIKYRQRASWQGEVTWVDQNKTERFRSALELLKLMDSAGNEKKVFAEE